MKLPSFFQGYKSVLLCFAVAIAGVAAALLLALAEKSVMVVQRWLESQRRKNMGRTREATMA